VHCTAFCFTFFMKYFVTGINCHVVITDSAKPLHILRYISISQNVYGFQSVVNNNNNNDICVALVTSYNSSRSGPEQPSDEGLKCPGFVSEWVSSVLRPLQHSIGYMGDGFYRSKDPTSSKVLKGHSTSITEKHNNRTMNTKHNKSPSLH